MKIIDYYTYSWFANLAYVNWEADAIGLLDAAANVAISNAHAAEIIPGDPLLNTVPLGNKIFKSIADGGEGWRVRAFTPDDLVGFSATLFVKTGIAAGSQEKILAVRGTNSSIEDLLITGFGQIGGLGIAIGQLVSLFNYVQLLRSGTNDMHVAQVRLRSSFDGLGGNVSPPSGSNSFRTKFGQLYWLEAAADGVGLGYVSEGDKLTITGHSLGGHLAIAAARLFPELFDNAVVFNSPGFDAVTGQQLTDEFVGLFAGWGGANPASNFSQISDRIINLESEDQAPGDDSSFVSSVLTGPVNPGSKEYLATERNSHLISPLMDSLGVLALLEQFGPSLGVDKANATVAAISNNPGNTHEALLVALGKLLLDSPPLVTYDDIGLDVIHSPGDFGARTSLHRTLRNLEIKGNELGAGTTVKLTSRV